MPRKTHIEPRKAPRRAEIMGWDVTQLPTSALMFWLDHYTTKSPMRRAMMDEINARHGIAR